MNTEDKRDLSITTFASVVVNKYELLKTLEANREKHNAIYDAAVSGYWNEAQKVLDQKKTTFDEAVAKIGREFTSYTGRLAVDFSTRYDELNGRVKEHDKDKLGSFNLAQSFSAALSFNAHWPLAYPENHLEDYDRVINMLKMSVADKVELNAGDFDAYVRNNWSWRKSFLTSNVGYVNNYLTGCLMPTYGLSATGYAIGRVISCSGSSAVATWDQLNRQF